MAINLSDNDPLHPCYPCNVLVGTTFYASVADFMQKECHSEPLKALQYVYLHRVGQDITIQSIFQGGHRSFESYDVKYPWTKYIPQCFEYLFEQFGLIESGHLMNMIPPIFIRENMNCLFDQEKRFVYFKRAHPFVGRDRALYLTSMWLNQNVVGSVFSPELEKEIALYDF